MLMLASALAYSSFFAIPSVLLVAVGLFTLLAGPQTIASLIHAFGHVMPAQATQLLSSSLHRLDHHPSTTIAMTLVGSDVIGPKIKYSRLRASTGKVLLVFLGFIFSLCLGSLAGGFFSFVGVGAAALLFGICWTGFTSKH